LLHDNKCKPEGILRTCKTLVGDINFPSTFTFFVEISSVDSMGLFPNIEPLSFSSDGSVVEVDFDSPFGFSIVVMSFGRIL
jgi:hypothetical protein